MRGDTPVVIVEEFIKFDSEITLLTIKQRPNVHLVLGNHLVPPSGTDRSGATIRVMDPTSYESIRPPTSSKHGKDGDGSSGRSQRGGIVRRRILVRGKKSSSELSPRPHDTGMVTMISQDPSEFELHLRAILGLPIHHHRRSPKAKRGDFGHKDQDPPPNYRGSMRHCRCPKQKYDLGKPTTRKWRRMGLPCHKATHSDKLELGRRKQRA